jgi:hypothetical protein
VGSPVLRKDRGLGNLTQEKLPMSTDTTVSSLRQRMIDMPRASSGPKRARMYAQLRAAIQTSETARATAI